MVLEDVESGIKRAIDVCQFKIDKRETFCLTDLEVDIWLDRKSNLKTALEIIENTK